MISFPDWVAVSTCETRTNTEVINKTLAGRHGAKKRVITFENHEMICEYNVWEGKLNCFRTNPPLPMRLKREVVY